MEKTKFQELNQLTTNNLPEKRIGNGRREKPIRNAGAYHENRRNGLRREDDMEKAEEIKKNPLPPKDKLGKPGESIDLFKNSEEE